jgi:hypothetical protein
MKCLFLAFLMISLVLAGCDKHRERKAARGDNDAPKKSAPPEIVRPQIEGKWVGKWESIKNKGHEGTVVCEAIHKSKDEWTAVIHAEYGPEMKFNIDLKGVWDGKRIRFEGELDLGEKEAGIFTWTGWATDSKFSGEYQGPGENGVFSMTRVDPVIAEPKTNDQHATRITRPN